MNFSIALPKTPDTLPHSLGCQGSVSPKSADPAGAGMFAAMFDSSSTVVPADPLATNNTTDAIEDRHDEELPSGKILPVGFAGVGNVALIETGAQNLPPVSGAPGNLPRGIDYAATLNSFGSGGAAAMLSPNQSMSSSASGLPLGADATANGKPAIQIANDAAQSVTGIKVSIAAATEPHDAKYTPLTGKQPVPIEPEAKDGKAADKAEGGERIAIRPAALPTAADARLERGSSKLAPIDERRNYPAQVTAVSDTAKAGTSGNAAPLMESFDHPRTAMATPRAVAADPFSEVERVVEHLNLARQFDLSKPASISLAHREFGALTVTFDQSERGVEVEVAAENRDAQRALAAAMTSERGLARQQDTSFQSSASNQQGPTTGERNNSSNSSGMAAGQNHGGNDSEHGSQHSRPRDRQDERTPSNSRAPAVTPRDDGLFA